MWLYPARPEPARRVQGCLEQRGVAAGKQRQRGPPGLAAFAARRGTPVTAQAGTPHLRHAVHAALLDATAPFAGFWLLLGGCCRVGGRARGRVAMAHAPTTSLAARQQLQPRSSADSKLFPAASPFLDCAQRAATHAPSSTTHLLASAAAAAAPRRAWSLSCLTQARQARDASLQHGLASEAGERWRRHGDVTAGWRRRQCAARSLRPHSLPSATLFSRNLPLQMRRISAAEEGRSLPKGPSAAGRRQRGDERTASAAAPAAAPPRRRRSRRAAPSGRVAPTSTDGKSGKGGRERERRT